MPKSLLDPTFKYVPAAETDLRRTFARIRREQAKIKAEQEVCDLQREWQEVRAAYKRVTLANTPDS
jgi:hypothetical protein